MLRDDYRLELQVFITSEDILDDNNYPSSMNILTAFQIANDQNVLIVLFWTYLSIYFTQQTPNITSYNNVKRKSFAQSIVRKKGDECFRKNETANKFSSNLIGHSIYFRKDLRLLDMKLDFKWHLAILKLFKIRWHFKNCICLFYIIYFQIKVNSKHLQTFY